MSRKGMYKYLSDLVSTGKKLVEFSLSSTIFLKLPLQTKPLLKQIFQQLSFAPIETQKQKLLI